jgi:outer membrane lipoprotein
MRSAHRPTKVVRKSIDKGHTRQGHQSWWVLLFLVAFSCTGCGHVISKDLRLRADPSVTFTKVHQNPEAYKGSMVVWGGEIVEAVNQKDEATFIEVFQRPLSFSEQPDTTLPSEGRFMVVVEKFLDTYPLKQGRRITVAGEIAGEKTKPLGEIEYRYPLILSRQMYLWPEYYCPQDYPPFNYYFRGPFGPWPPYPYWYPYGLYRCYPW